MKIKIQDDTLELMRKALSITLSCTATELRAVDTLLSVVNKFELNNGIYLLTTIIANYNKVNHHLNLPLALSLELLNNSFDAVVYSLIQSPNVQVTSLTDEVLSPGIPEQAERIASLLKKDLQDEYEILKEYSITKEELLPVLQALRQSFQHDLCVHYVRLQAMCMSDPVYIDKKKYQGIEGFTTLAQLSLADISTLDNMEDDLKMIRSAEDERRYAGGETYATLFPVNLGPIDMIGGIMSNTITIVQAAPNIGKTTFLCYLASEAKRFGVTPAIYGGETREDKLWHSIMSHDFYRDTGYMLNWKFFRNPQKVEDEALRAKVLIYKETYFQSKGGLLSLDNINLSNFSNIVTKAYEEENVRVFMIDNVASFSPGQVKIMNPNSTAGKKEIVDNLSKQMIKLKKDYPISFIIANWTKTKTIHYGDDNFTITSGLNQDADGLIEMSNVEGLSESLKAFHIKKWRLDEKVIPLFLTETFYTCCEFKYNPEIQHLLEGY